MDGWMDGWMDGFDKTVLLFSRGFYLQSAWIVLHRSMCVCRMDV